MNTISSLKLIKVSYLFPILEFFKRNQDRPEIESQSPSNCEGDDPYQVSVENTDSTNLHPPTRGPVKSRDAELTNISMIWGRVEADLLKIFLKS